MFQRIWTSDMIKEYILSSNGKEPLNSHYFSTRYPSIYAAAERIYGSWENAIQASGLDYSNIRKYKVWTKARIIKTVKEMYKNGEPISSNAVQRNNKSLYMAAIHRFSSWGKTVKMAGIDYTRIRKRRSLSRDEIKKEIVTLYKQGENMAYTNMRENYQYLLSYGMKKLGDGSWAKARYVCGIKTNYRLAENKRKSLELKMRRAENNTASSN